MVEDSGGKRKAGYSHETSSGRGMMGKDRHKHLGPKPKEMEVTSLSKKCLK